MNKQYSLHEAYGKHAYSYTGFCVGEWMIFRCACGAFSEGYNQPQPDVYRRERQDRLRLCFSETAHCLTDKRLRQEYEAFALRLLREYNIKPYSLIHDAPSLETMKSRGLRRAAKEKDKC